MKEVSSIINTHFYGKIYNNIYNHADEHPDIEVKLWVPLEKEVYNQVLFKVKREINEK